MLCDIFILNRTVFALISNSGCVAVSVGLVSTSVFAVQLVGKIARQGGG